MAGLLSIFLYLLPMFGYVLPSPVVLPTYNHHYSYECNGTITTDKAYLLEVDRQTLNTSECVIRLQTSPTYRFSLSYYFSHSNVQILFCQNSLEVYFQEYSVNKTDCQLFTEETPSVTLFNVLDIYFYYNISSENDTNDDGSVTLLIVPFHMGNCTQYEYHCSTGRCVDSALYCNPGYDTCGDRDCPGDDSGTTGAIIVALIAVGCIVIITCLVACACCCFLAIQKRQKTQQNRMTAMSMTGTHNPAQSSTFPVLTTPPYTASYNPPPYSANPDVFTDNHFTTQAAESVKGREVTLKGEMDG